MDVLAHFFNALPILPSIIANIQRIHGNALDGASKKELAMEALGLSEAVAATALPEDQLAIQAATELASNSIDGFVKLLHATKKMPKPLPTVVPAPAKA